MKRVLILLLTALVLARGYDLYTQTPDASLSQIVTLLAPPEIWVAGIVLWTAIVVIRRYI